MALVVDSRFAVGVKVPVQVLPPSLEASVLRVPLASVRSVLSKLVTASLKVIDTPLVSPALSALSASTMLAVGAVLSSVKLSGPDATLVLPAKSVWRT